MFVPFVGLHALEHNYLTKPESGNIARDTQTKKDLADAITKSYYEATNQGQDNDEKDDRGDAF